MIKLRWPRISGGHTYTRTHIHTHTHTHEPHSPWKFCLFIKPCLWCVDREVLLSTCVCVCLCACCFWWCRWWMIMVRCFSFNYSKITWNIWAEKNDLTKSILVCVCVCVCVYLSNYAPRHRYIFTNSGTASQQGIFCKFTVGHALNHAKIVSGEFI